jgi:Tfp pilus assembly protein PilX
VSSRHQGGVALFVSLVLLVLLTALALSGFRLSVGALRNAVGEELRVDAFQNAQSLIDMTLAVPANTAVTGAVDRANCLPGVTDADCSGNTISTPVGMGSAGISVKVRRLAPEFSPPPRGTGYSALKFAAAQMQVESRYDATTYGWGRDQLQEGVAVIVPVNE